MTDTPRLPELAVVLEKLRAGKRIQADAGRYYKVYFMEADVLRCQIFDEGHVEVIDATVDELRSSIQHHPEAFRSA